MRRLAMLAILCLPLAACGGEGGTAAPPADPAAEPAPGESESEAPPAEPTQPGEAEPAATGTATETEATDAGAGSTSTPEALDFEASLVGGGTFRGSDYDGRDVALWFWAPW